ncbi:TRAP transporter substrate-binding protein [Nitratireductor pacificus]|uniref:TRAP transporter substrate-binding protein n=1 Tax=Nitratireductor pacificus TaxID=1231180 RepID=UPI0012F6377A|nr:TRAP transporter substrate-binding protein [Nitratireductor pacificus]
MRRTAAGIAGLLGLALAAAAGTASAAELKVSHFMSPMHHMQARVLEPWTKKLADEAGGELTFRIFPSGELSKSPAAQWKTALTGVTDIAFGLPGYTTENFPRTMLAVSPGIFETAAEATNAIWDNIEDIAPDYERAKLLAVWGSEPAVLMTRNKPVKTLADVKGLKIRTADQVSASIIEAWGGTPVPLPASEIYTAMDTGVIDGLFIDPSGVPSFRLDEVVNHVTLGLPTPSSAFFLVMNQNAWNGLTDAQKAMLDGMSGRQLSLDSAASYAQDAEKGMDILKKADKEIITLDAEAQAEFVEATKPVADKLIADAEGRGVANAADIAAALGKKK